jgi:hypothetical protein
MTGMMQERIRDSMAPTPLRQREFAGRAPLPPHCLRTSSSKPSAVLDERAPDSYRPLNLAVGSIRVPTVDLVRSPAGLFRK